MSFPRQAGAAVRYTPYEKLRRPTLPKATIAGVFARDRFTCRYCGVRTIPPVILRVLSALYPDELPYDPHWKAAHPAYWKIASSVDHIEAGSSGGDWTDPASLVTACYQCNQTKSNVTIEHSGWTANRPGVIGWDGLTGSYPGLWELAGRPHPDVHRPWLRAFGAVVHGSIATREAPAASSKLTTAACAVIGRR
jgi:5-methylcytosine-specific restriction endonuclease McrA